MKVMYRDRKRKRKVSLFDVTEMSKSKQCVDVINRWAGRLYSKRYYEILEKRKELPVWHHKPDFLKALFANQCLILVGETGSGKTTQV